MFIFQCNVSQIVTLINYIFFVLNHKASIITRDLRLLETFRYKEIGCRFLFMFTEELKFDLKEFSKRKAGR